MTLPFESPDHSDRETWERKWMEEHGLRRARGHVCVRRLALGRCEPRGAQLGCSMSQRVFDHSAIYLRQGKPACIVGHEYPKESDDLRRWLEYLDLWPQLGLRLDGESWYYPGATFLVVLYNREVWGSHE